MKMEHEYTGGDDRSVVSIRLETELTAEQLAASLGTPDTGDDALLELVEALDLEIGTWEFTLRLAHRVAGLLEPYAEETGDAALSASASGLMRSLEEILARGGQDRKN